MNTRYKNNKRQKKKEYKYGEKISPKNYSMNHFKDDKNSFDFYNSLKVCCKFIVGAMSPRFSLHTNTIANRCYAEAILKLQQLQ